MKQNITAKLQEYELRINRLSELALETGKLQERKRIADLLYNKYQEAFTSDPEFAAKLYPLIDEVIADA